MFSPPDVVNVTRSRINARFKGAVRSLILAGIVLGSASSIQADPITIGVWQEFFFGGTGSQAVSCFIVLVCAPSQGGNAQFAPSAPWTFTLGPGGGFLTVTDANLFGDAFDIFDFGVLIGSTPSVPIGVPFNGDCGNDPVPCLANPGASHAVFSVGPGSHSIEIFARESPHLAGVGYFRVDAVPEPATMVLLGTGLLGILGAVRRRQAKE